MLFFVHRHLSESLNLHRSQSVLSAIFVHVALAPSAKGKTRRARSRLVAGEGGAEAVVIDPSTSQAWRNGSVRSATFNPNCTDVTSALLPW
jgi:hypothetical protein